MKETHKLLEELVAKAEQYGESSVELVKLKSARHIANAAGEFTTHLSVWVALVLAVLMFSVGASIWLGEELGHYYLGFMIVAGFYLLLALAIKLFKSGLVQRPIQNCVIRYFFKK